MWDRIGRIALSDRWTNLATLSLHFGFIASRIILFPANWPPARWLLLLTAPPGIAFAVALWRRAAWARFAGIPFYLLASAAYAYLLLQDGFSLVDLIGPGCLLYGAWLCRSLDLYDDLDPAERAALETPAAEADQPLSLVLLLREPPHFEASILARLASQAWGLEITSSEDDPQDFLAGEQQASGADPAGDFPRADEPPAAEGDGFLVGSPPSFVCQHPTGMFLIHVRDEPYWEEEALPGVIAELDELRTRQAVAEHQAWVAIDVLHDRDRENPAELRAAYQILGRFLAAIADDNTLAVIAPERRLIYPYDPETEAKLQSDDPLAALAELYYSPIITVQDDDPALLAAVAEARRRWDEFVAAFAARDPDGPPPLVKAPFSQGENTEFMWVAVTALENGLVYGTLENEPARLPRYRKGQRVQVKEAEVNDWMILRNGAPLGGFTLAALKNRSRR